MCATASERSASSHMHKLRTWQHRLYLQTMINAIYKRLYTCRKIILAASGKWEGCPPLTLPPILVVSGCRLPTVLSVSASSHANWVCYSLKSQCFVSRRIETRQTMVQQNPIHSKLQAVLPAKPGNKKKRNKFLVTIPSSSLMQELTVL